MRKGWKFKLEPHGGFVLTPAPFQGNLWVMQTLGVADRKERDDGRLKSIFWPTVETAWDVDHLGRQGFWICLIIAAYQLIFSLISGNPVALVSGVVAALVFFVGGMGVRESNWPAAALVFCLFSVNLLYGIATAHFPGILTIVGTGMLLANVRAAFIASTWRPPAEGEDRPTRFSETFGDKLADQMPAKVWPLLQIPFFGVATLMVVLSVAGSAILFLHRYGLLTGPHPVQEEYC